jgi:hypothetical protein
VTPAREKEIQGKCPKPSFVHECLLVSPSPIDTEKPLKPRFFTFLQGENIEDAIDRAKHPLSTLITREPGFFGAEAGFVSSFEKAKHMGSQLRADPALCPKARYTRDGSERAAKIALLL